MKVHIQRKNIAKVKCNKSLHITIHKKKKIKWKKQKQKHIIYEEFKSNCFLMSWNRRVSSYFKDVCIMFLKDIVDESIFINPYNSRSRLNFYMNIANTYIIALSYLHFTTFIVFKTKSLLRLIAKIRC